MLASKVKAIHKQGIIDDINLRQKTDIPGHEQLLLEIG
jgi:hypothetical protein